MTSPLFQKLQVFTCSWKTPALHLQFHNSSFLPAIQQQQLFACSPPTPAVNMQYRSSLLYICSSASSLRKHCRNLTISLWYYHIITAMSQQHHNRNKITSNSQIPNIRIATAIQYIFFGSLWLTVTLIRMDANIVSEKYFEKGIFIGELIFGFSSSWCTKCYK